MRIRRAAVPTKPSYKAITRRLSIAHRLEHAYLFNQPAGSTIRDLAGLADLTHGSTANNWAPGPLGMALLFFSAGNNGATRAAVPTILPPFSIQVVWKNTGSEFRVLFSHDPGSSAGYRAQMGSGSAFHLTFGAVADYTGVTGLTIDHWYTGVITCTANGGTAKTYAMRLGGGAILTNSESVGTVSGTPTALGVGCISTNTSVYDGYIALAAHWSRVLHPAEAVMLLRDPLAWVRPSTALPWLDVVAAVATKAFPFPTVRPMTPLLVR